MKKFYIPGFITVITLTIVVAFSISAFAQPGWHGRQGRGWHMGWDGNRGYSDNTNNLSDEQIEKLNKQMEIFFKETGDLRQKIIAKSLELRAELAKKNPDSQKAIKLQNELSHFEADLERKRIAHIIEIRKINPDAGSAYGYGPRGGRGYGNGRGRGFRDGGYCWR